MPDSIDFNRIDPSLPLIADMARLGLVNVAWAQLDAISSAALVEVLKADFVEVGIVAGRLEAQAKLHKIRKILLHRGEATNAGLLQEIIKRLDKLRPIRNAVTHGFYEGRTAQNELVFTMLAEFLVEEGRGTANETRVLTSTTLDEHISAVNATYMELIKIFGSTLQVSPLPGRVPSPSAANLSQGRGKNAR